MTDNDTIAMMRRCSVEIKMLRGRIVFLEPKAEGWDTLRQVLGLLPKPATGSGEDLAWKLDQEISSMEAAKKAFEDDAAQRQEEKVAAYMAGRVKGQSREVDLTSEDEKAAKGEAEAEAYG